MEKCKLIMLFGKNYTCEMSCCNYDSVSCKLNKECINNPYKCNYFNPTYSTLINEIVELTELKDSWNFD